MSRRIVDEQYRVVRDATPTPPVVGYGKVVDSLSPSSPLLCTAPPNSNSALSCVAGAPSTPIMPGGTPALKTKVNNIYSLYSSSHFTSSPRLDNSSVLFDIRHVTALYLQPCSAVFVRLLNVNFTWSINMHLSILLIPLL